MGFWRSDRLLFSLVSVLLMGRNLQHLLMLPWSCCKRLLDFLGFLQSWKLRLSFWTCILPFCCLEFLGSRPRQPVFGNAEVKFVAGVADLVWKFPSAVGFLQSLINNLGDDIALNSMICFAKVSSCLRGFPLLLCRVRVATLVLCSCQFHS
mgnify:CR=1 FL=1